MAAEHERISAVVPVTERFDDVAATYQVYKDGVAASGNPYEFVYVLDGQYPEVAAALERLKEQGEPIRVVQLAKWFGEATALTIGFSHASGSIILTLPAYQQVKAEEIPRLLAALDDHDMVVARRHPRRDPGFNLLQSKAFHGLLRSFLDLNFHDLGCGVRALRRRVIDEVRIYGDHHRFLPILAQRRGFRIRELDVAQAESDATRRVYRPGTYIRRLLDILGIVFLVKFTEKPLRFFGLIGSVTFTIGLLYTSVLAVQRLAFGVGLADRPALILGALLIVLGIQIIAVGLIGEIIIFTRAKDLKQYDVETELA